MRTSSKAYHRVVILLTSLFFLSSQFITSAQAGVARNEQIVITTPTSIRITGNCVSFDVSYKIMPNYREIPGFVRLGLSKDPNFTAFGDGATFAYNFLYYNVDLLDVTWVDQNVDFLGEVRLEFCPNDRESETGASLIGLTSPGTYFVWAYSSFNTENIPRPDRLDSTWLSTSIKITGNLTITCKKGKVTKKVTSLNPKCPAGFKKVV